MPPLSEQPIAVAALIGCGKFWRTPKRKPARPIAVAALIGCGKGPESRIAGVELDPEAWRTVMFEIASL